MQADDVAVRVLLYLVACDEVRALESYFIAREESEVLLHRNFHEVVAVHPEFFSERDLSCAHLRHLAVVLNSAHLDLVLRIVVDDYLDRILYNVDSRHLELQIFSDALLELSDVDGRISLGYADVVAELADGFRCVASSAYSSERAQSRIVPAFYLALFNKSSDESLAHQHRCYVKRSKFDLARRIWPPAYFPYHPVIQRSVIFELECADGVRDALDGVLDRMREIVHRIDAPFISGVVVRSVHDSVDNRVSHVDVRACHVDLCPEAYLAVSKLARSHSFEKLEILLYRPVSVRAFLARLCKSASVFADLVRSEFANKGLSLLYELYCSVIHRIEVI